MGNCTRRHVCVHTKLPLHTAVWRCYDHNTRTHQLSVWWCCMHFSCGAAQQPHTHPTNVWWCQLHNTHTHQLSVWWGCVRVWAVVHTCCGGTQQCCNMVAATTVYVEWRDVGYNLARVLLTGAARSNCPQQQRCIWSLSTAPPSRGRVCRSAAEPRQSSHWRHAPHRGGATAQCRARVRRVGRCAAALQNRIKALWCKDTTGEVSATRSAVKPCVPTNEMANNVVCV